MCNPRLLYNNATTCCFHNHWPDAGKLWFSWQFALFLAEQVTVKSSSIKNIHTFQFRASSSHSQMSLNLRRLSGFTVIYPPVLLLLPDDRSEFINALSECSISHVKLFSIHGFCSYNQGSCQLSPKMTAVHPYIPTLQFGERSLRPARGFVLYTSHQHLG